MGGLVRAYQAAVKAGLEASSIIEKQEGIKGSLCVDYTTVGKLQYVFEKNGYTVLESKYEESVTFILLIPKEEWDAAVKMITEATMGRVELKKEEECIYGTVAGRAVVF
jgi:putative IMPACT (imprinted ancient) family translation regulator